MRQCPAGWEVRPLGQLLRRPPRYGVNAAAVPASSGDFTYIRITDIDELGRFRPKPKVGVRHPRAHDYLLGPGQLVFARTGASVGKSYLYRPADGVLVYAGFLINLEPDPSLLEPGYLALYGQTGEYWAWVAQTSVRSGQPGINGREYSQLRLPVPPPHEQRQIIEVLSDIDGQIDEIERLVAKRRNFRLGLAQELLSARTRLPGFTGEWSPTTLGGVGTFHKGRGIKRGDVRRAGVRCIRYGELYTTYRDFTDRTVSYVSGAIAGFAFPLKTGDLLFAGSGETREEIGMCVAYTGDDPAVAGSDIVILRPFEANPVFVALLANASASARMKSRLGQGDAVVHISSRALAQIELRVPERDEQDSIARVIIDADREVSLLEARLNKAIMLKLGIAQSLLAGGTRLPEGELQAA